MYRPFREYHILSILNEYDQNSLPLDLSLNHYLRNHKAIGSKDRGYIAETIYSMMRWKGLLDYLAGESPSWEKRLDLYLCPSFGDAKYRQDIPLHDRLSFPKYLFDRLVDSHGLDKACDICRISNTAAPTTVRINTLKTSRDAMLKQWGEKYPVSPCTQAPHGITFNRRVNFFELPEFK
ncbi:MAG: RsmB/NOP family class I SAM-dependent RNA methyltransferase, partial [Parachlamydiaceae bacterium]